MKALKNRRVQSALIPVLFGDASLAAQSSFEFHVVSTLRASDRRPGRPTHKGGLAQLAYVTALIQAAKAGEVDGMCTAPVSKESISRAGVSFVGHTELLAEAFGRQVLMLMDGPRLRVALATNHLAIRDVPNGLSSKGLLSQLRLLDAALQPMIGRRPKLAMCALNPHAGEGGLFGDEEHRILIPAIRAAKKGGIDVAGPLAADGLFAQSRSLPYDAVLAMFHDQALIAAKMLDFSTTVNVTLGLPIVRTSPDHGVAYDLSGKNRADPTPMISALLKAATYTAAARRS